MARPLIGITIGDPNGIGPEIALKCLLDTSIQDFCRPVLIGPIDAYSYYARRLRIGVPMAERDAPPPPRRRRAEAPPPFPVLRILPQDGGGARTIRPAPPPPAVIRPGAISSEGGRAAGQAITRAAQLCLRGELDGMVTAPVSKEAMALAGYRYPGQTEMLSDLSRSRGWVMLLVAGRFRVGLATVHRPLRQVPRALSTAGLCATLGILRASLRSDFGISAPTIAVLGLNPHAGEHGLLGGEEDEIIRPAISMARRKGIRAEGPFPADGFFGRQMQTRYSAVLAMYHDQGLVPLKMSGFSIGVNYSAGLPIVRTSPDHGTAFDIAGRGIADPGSMKEAIRLAAEIAGRRKRRAGAR